MRTFILSLFLLIVISYSSFAQIAGFNGLNPLSGKLALSFEGGTTYTFADYKNAEFDYYLRTMGEYLKAYL